MQNDGYVLLLSQFKCVSKLYCSISSLRHTEAHKIIVNLNKTKRTLEKININPR